MDSIHRLERDDAHFPRRIHALADAPPALWYRGRLPDSEGRALAIVGSRAASGAAVRQTRAWAAALASEGWSVISGGALGIDAAAHEGALDGGGLTHAVLGCGVDVVYPDRHVALFRRIAETGGLLSEFAPGAPPRTWHFPRRNRLVVALAEAVLVVEAGARSGALITADLARAAGKRLLAVPGSAGTDHLIGAGATAVRSLDDVRAVLAGGAAAVEDVPEKQAALITALRAGATTPVTLAQRLGLTVPGVMGLLTEAELDGRIRRAGGSHYEVLRGH